LHFVSPAYFLFLIQDLAVFPRFFQVLLELFAGFLKCVSDCLNYCNFSDWFSSSAAYRLCCVVCRHQLVQMLCVNPPFAAKDSSSSLNSLQLVDRIWKLMKLVRVDCLYVIIAIFLCTTLSEIVPIYMACLTLQMIVCTAS